jgi:hypothetical protein
MTAIVGVVVALLSGAAFWYFLPRGGRTASFVGSEWESYIVVIVVVSFVIGLMLIVSGLVPATA